jgi:hypothetical protein
MTENKLNELKIKIIALLQDFKENKNIRINMNGIVTKRNERNNDEFDVESETFLNQISKCMEEIKILYEPLKSVYNIYSYGGKHYIEKYRDHIKSDDYYISNGEFIVSMLLSGYKYKYDSGPNMCFRGRRAKDWDKILNKIENFSNLGLYKIY